MKRFSMFTGLETMLFESGFLKQNLNKVFQPLLSHGEGLLFLK